MRKRTLRLVSGAAAISTLCAWAQPAFAYNWRTHSRLVESAVYTMEFAATAAGATTPAPTGVDPTQWSNYLTAIAAAVPKLNALQTGVANPGSEDTNVCQYRTSDNMSQLPFDRIEDVAYLPIKGGQVINGSQVNPNEPGQLEGLAKNGCSEVLVTSPCTSDLGLRLGRVLGWQAASTDEHMEDSVLWYRPTNSQFTDLLGAAVLTVPALVTGAIVVSIVCVWDFLTGGNCGSAFDAPFNLTNKVNPLNVLTSSWLGGVDPNEDYVYVGLWHFMDAASFSGKTNQYNASRLPGLQYDQAGPKGAPGAVDVAIMIGSDATGLSVDPSQSAGVTRYAQYDDKSRSNSDWWGQTIGHVEFSTLDNLAQYGWQSFLNTATPGDSQNRKRTSAFFLSYPLHAFGDACQPMHVAGTTGYGHRPYEDFTDHLLDSTFMPPPQSCTAPGLLSEDSSHSVIGSDQLNRLLVSGFNFWSKYHGQFGVGSVPVRAMLNDLAQQTFTMAHTTQGDALFDDGASTEYEATKPLGSNNIGMTDAISKYNSKQADVPPLLELGSGAIIAFLTGVSQSVVDPGLNPQQNCLSSQQYEADSGACVAMTPPPAQPPTNNSFCMANGDCSGLGPNGCVQCSEAFGCTDPTTVCSAGCCIPASSQSLP